MDVDRPEPGGAPRVVVVELEHMRGALGRGGKRRAGATFVEGSRSENNSQILFDYTSKQCDSQVSRFSAACLLVANQHPPTRLAHTRTYRRRRLFLPARSPAAGMTFAPMVDHIRARLDHIPARASEKRAVQNVNELMLQEKVRQGRI